MFRWLILVFAASSLITQVVAQGHEVAISIVHDAEATGIERFAAQEVRRYVYVRTGALLQIRPGLDKAASPQSIAVGTKQRFLVGQRVTDDAFRKTIEQLGPEEYVIKKVTGNDRSSMLIVGGDEIGTLYGAYRFAEHLGIRFYLHGDVVPDQQVPFTLSELDETGKPLFQRRGIQPFHDFPEGPDWWDADAYKAVLGQLPKLRMNFFGLHTYPEGQVGPEPTVWIGPPDALSDDGKVRASYPARHFVTSNVTSAWGYQPRKTRDYAFGAAAMFSRDDYGAEYMVDTFPWDQMEQDRCNALFERFGLVLKESFQFARRLGVKTCVGTETPLAIPKAVRQRLVAAGKAPDDPETVKLLYEGMFRRIMAAYPIDYYWLWTPEGWTWQEVKQQQIDATLADFKAIQAAADAVGAPFQLATCGWVLGPPQNPALFDSVLPKEWPLSCINRNVGHDPVEPGFADVGARPRWAIPWIEDDPAMIVPQLWVGRMRKDAADALRYGCDGLLGIHWRTRILGPNVAALAHASWSQDGWKTAQVDQDPPELEGTFDQRQENYPPWRAVPSDDFYRDWAASQFGDRAGARIAPLFAKLDCALPRPSTWVDGPGGIKPDPRPWGKVSRVYGFVNTLRDLRPLVRGAGNLERFDYWLANFKYLRALGKLNCTWAELNATLAAMKAATNASARKQLAARKALPLRIRLIRELTYVQQHLLDTVTTKGAMGTVANWQQHVFPMLLDPSAKAIVEATGEPLSRIAVLPTKYPGVPRLFVPVLRTALVDGESLNVEAVVVGTRAVVAMIFWKPFGTKEFKSRPLKHVERGIFRTELTGKDIDSDFEYYIEVATDRKPLRFPATAPKLNQTVVLMR